MKKMVIYLITSLLLVTTSFVGLAAGKTKAPSSAKEAQNLSKHSKKCFTYKNEKFCKGIKQTSVHNLLENASPSPDGFGYVINLAGKDKKEKAYLKEVLPYQKKNNIDQNVLMFSKIGEKSRNYAITRVTNEKRRGKTSLRFEIRNGDCYTGHSGQLNDCATFRERAEVSNLWLAPMDVPVYYAYSIKLPKDYPEMDNPYQIIGQFHDNQANNFSNQYQGGQFYINVKYNHRDRLHDYVSNFTKGKWHDFIYKIVWSTDPKKGLVEVTMDGKKLFSYRGRNLSDGAQIGPYFKMGIYRSHLERYKHGKHPTQVIYYDEYRHGKTLESVSYKKNPPVD